VVLRQVWIGPFDLHEALRADFLVTTACFVEVRWIVEEADWAFDCMLVQNRFYRPAVDDSGQVVSFWLTGGARQRGVVRGRY